jgi:ribosomal protein S18 acetylase RimI-like enzyme
MATITIHAMTTDDVAKVVGLQQRVAAVYPEVTVRPGAMYLGPSFAEGQNAFCAWDKDGRLVGLAPILATVTGEPPQPYRMWADLKVDPAVEDQEEIGQQLLERLAARARETLAPLPANPAELLFQYYRSQKPAIAFVRGKGAVPGEIAFEMQRDLAQPLPEVARPAGFDIRRWKMESEAEQAAYVAALNEVFPDVPMTLGEWQYFMGSPHWAVGTTVTAFAGDEIAGSVAIFWDPAASGERFGYTEYIFVRAPWRKRGLARFIVREGLAYLKERGRTKAHLEVSAENDRGLGLYRSLGYEVVRQSQVYRLPLIANS